VQSKKLDCVAESDIGVKIPLFSATQKCIQSYLILDFDLNAIRVPEAPARALPVKVTQFQITRTQLHHFIKFDVRLLRFPGTCHFEQSFFHAKKWRLRSSVGFRPDELNGANWIHETKTRPLICILPPLHFLILSWP
jgi:hypothetical protein